MHELIYYSFRNSKQSLVKIFLYKVYIVCSICPPLAEAHAFRRLWKSFIALLIVVSKSSHPRSAAVLFRSGWSWDFEWSLWNAWSMHCPLHM